MSEAHLRWVGAASLLAAACAASGLPSSGTQACAPVVRPIRSRTTAHGPGWMLRHRVEAGADSASCGQCHTNRSCIDCHDGRTRPRELHPADWLVAHSVAARQRSGTCSSCHRRQSFCLPCHQRTGVAERAPLATIAQQGRIHPPTAEWTDSPRSAQHHAWQAQRRLATCVSCHTERDCVLCHASTTADPGGSGLTGLGRGIAPHPRGFARWCRGPLRANARPCLVCHDGDDPSLDRCR
jgi:hypothetical protein